MKSTHTPTKRPWYISENLVLYCPSENHDSQDVDEVVCEATFPEDAAYIVKCVNSHEELVNFVKEVKRIADNGMLTPAWSRMAERILSKAEGK